MVDVQHAPPDRLPDRRVVIRLDFTGFRPHERYWLLIEHGETEICKTYPGLDEGRTSPPTPKPS